MSDIFQEVEEDLRRDRLDEFLKKYGPWMMVIAGAFIILLAGILWWGDYQDKQRAGRSDAYLAAMAQLEAGDREAGIAALDAVIDQGNKGYAALALLSKGTELAATGDKAGAMAAYDELADSNLGDAIIRDLARVKAGWIASETEDFATVQAKMAEVVSGGSSWAPAAKEVVAFSAFKSGELETARGLFIELLNDQTAPSGIRGRSGELLAIIVARIGLPETSHEGHDHASENEGEVEAQGEGETSGDEVLEEPVAETGEGTGGE